MFSQSKRNGPRRGLEDEEGEEKLKPHSPEDDPPGQVVAVHAEAPGEEPQNQEAEDGLGPTERGGSQTPFELVPQRDLDRRGREVGPRPRPERPTAGLEPPRTPVP